MIQYFRIAGQWCVTWFNKRGEWQGREYGLTNEEIGQLLGGN